MLEKRAVSRKTVVFPELLSAIEPVLERVRGWGFLAEILENIVGNRPVMV
jgi:hypothetical protein